MVQRWRMNSIKLSYDIMSNSRSLLFLGTILLFGSCAEEKEILISEPPFEEVCVLNQNEELLGQINSIDYVNDTSFVVCSASQIYLYGFSGDLIRKIGRSERAKAEYVSPRIVRYGSNHIVAWDGMLGKFIWFNMDGQALGEVGCETAVSDFIVDGDYLWIYTADAESDGCVVKLNVNTGEAESQNFILVDGGHHILTRWSSRAPMVMDDGVLWCMPKNKLEIYRSDSDQTCRFESSSFTAENIDDPNSLISARQKMEEYLCNNSVVVAIHPMKRDMRVLTAEGYLQRTKDGLDRSHRYYSVYSVNLSSEKAKCLIRFPQESFSLDHLMIGPNCFYCLSHKVSGEDDQYAIEKIVLGSN